MMNISYEEIKEGAKTYLVIKGSKHESLRICLTESGDVEITSKDYVWSPEAIDHTLTQINELPAEWAPTEFERWKVAVASCMDDAFRESLDAECPHQSETRKFKFREGEVYQVTYTPDLNRHDKTYYYVDNWGPTVDRCTFEKL